MIDHAKLRREVVDRVTRIYEEEAARNSKATSREDIPLSFEHITPEWLTAVLYPHLPDVAVTGFSLGPVDDGTSNRRHIYVDYNDRGRELELPASLFAKGSQSLLTRISYVLNHTINRETDFYALVRPRLDIKVINSLFSNHDMESGASIILFEDVGDQVTFQSEFSEISQERAQDMVRLLADMHAPFTHPEALETLKGHYLPWPDMWDTLIASEFEEYSNAGFLAAKHVIPEGLYARFAEVWPRTLDSVEMQKQLPATFCHGDTQLGNWFVWADGRAGLGDWGGAILGHWSRDIAYGIATWLTTENRRLWERDLIRIYLERLQERGARDVPSFEDAFLWYRQQMLSALTYWTVQVTPSPNVPEGTSANLRIDCFIQRLATAADDLQSLDSFG